MEGFNIELGLGALVWEAFLRFETATCFDFGLFVGISCHRGHGECLRLKWLFYEMRRKPYPS